MATTYQWLFVISAILAAIGWGILLIEKQNRKFDKRDFKSSIERLERINSEKDAEILKLNQENLNLRFPELANDEHNKKVKFWSDVLIKSSEKLNPDSPGYQIISKIINQLVFK